MSERTPADKLEAAAASDVLAMREALRHARSVIESGVDSDYGRKWIWPDSAHKTIIRESKEALAQIDAALSAQGEAKPETNRQLLDALRARTAEFVQTMRDGTLCAADLGTAVATPEPQEGRKPLSLVKINELRRAAVHGPADWVVHFARAVERAQGITQDGEPS